MGVVRPIWALGFRCGAVVLLGGWLAIASSVSAAHAAGGVTGNLRGNVVDSQTQSPIAAARVTAVGGSGNYHTSTDSHGFFALLQLPTDTYTVGISKDGYVPQVIAGVTVLGDESQSVGIIKLIPSPRSLGKVLRRSNRRRRRMRPLLSARASIKRSASAARRITTSS